MLLVDNQVSNYCETAKVDIVNFYKIMSKLEIKNFLSKNKLLIIIVFFALLVFIWWGYRPSIIRTNCEKEASSLASDRDVGTDFLQNQKIYDIAYDSAYKECLNAHGL